MPGLGKVWQAAISSPDRERAFQALEVATLFALRRAVRNGSVWIEHSLSFRGRARLFFTYERWKDESKKHYARLSLPGKAATQGYTDLAMALARLLGFDLCPRLKELKQRHLFVPRGAKVPAEIAALCEANVDVALIEKHWDSLVHLAASVMSGHASAVAALARFGSAAQGDPIYDAGVQLGRLLRTAFLADYFVKDGFRNELRRVLNRGEAVNALKRAIYTGRISPAQAKRVDEMQAVADALSLLANIVMAWNTSQMQAVLDRWSNRRQVIPPELIGKITPTRLESINLRGVFRFPVDRYADQILPSRQGAPITGTNG